MGAGGARTGAGRKLGGQNEVTKQLNAILKASSPEIMKVAIEEAVKNRNVAVLNKLLDKIQPNLNINQHQNVTLLPDYIRSFFHRQGIEVPEDYETEAWEDDSLNLLTGGEGEEDGN
jgi:hypothetical protein